MGKTRTTGTKQVISINWGKTNWVKTIRTAIASAAALAFAMCGSVALAQGQTRPAAGAAQSSGSNANAESTTRTNVPLAGNKIACINLRAAIASTAEGQQAAKQLESQFAERRKELEDLNKKINDLQQKLQAGGSVMRDDEKNKLTLEGQKLTRQLDRRQNEFQEDLGDAQNEVVQRIGRRVVEVIGKYAPNNGYSAVLDDSAQATPVMYASTDITQDIVKLYDQTYPTKASATPADAKPGAKTPATKPSGQ